MVDGIINEFLRLAEDSVKNIKQFVKGVYGEINGLKTDVTAVITALSSTIETTLIGAWRTFLNWLRINIPTIVGFVDQITTAVSTLNNTLLGSPKSKIQYALEDLYGYLNTHDFSFSINQTVQPQAVASIQSMLTPAPVFTGGTTNDNSIAVNVSGVPIRSQEDLSHDLIMRLQMLKGVS